MTAPAGTPRGSRLGRLARGAGEARAAGAAAASERCELCGEPIAPEHRHLLDLETRELMCACQACKILFDRGAAGGGHYRLVPDRRLRLEDLELDDALWDALRVPVDMAFFFRSSQAGRVLAFYPSPMGPTESELTLSAWADLVERNPVLRTMAPDVEALLVDRVGGARRHWLVGVDECYALVGLIRTRWRGLSGGTEVWGEITAFFRALDERSRPASRLDAGTTTTEEAPWQS
jgi:hypothetical protein